jgi:hypothetical protein
MFITLFRHPLVKTDGYRSKVQPVDDAKRNVEGRFILFPAPGFHVIVPCVAHFGCSKMLKRRFLLILWDFSGKNFPDKFADTIITLTFATPNEILGLDYVSENTHQITIIRPQSGRQICREDRKNCTWYRRSCNRSNSFADSQKDLHCSSFTTRE